MMHRVHMSIAAVATAGCLLLAGCNAGVSPLQTAAAGSGAAKGSAAWSQRVSNISGDYIGTMHDAQGGTGAAKATLAQHTATAGGAIRDKESSQTIVADMSVTITPQNSTSGAMVIDFPPVNTGQTCTFRMSGTYDPTSDVLRGSYVAVTGCAGDTGTFKLTQQCHDTDVTGDTDATGDLVRPFNNPHC
jgi:hypothetical protein